MSHTVTWIEVAWTAGNLIGLSVNLWAWQDARADLRWLLRSGLNGARDIVARANVRREGVRVTIQSMFVAVGVAAMTTAPPPGDGRVSVAALVASGAFIGAGVALVYASVADRHDRRRLMGVLAPRYMPDEGTGEGGEVST